MRIPRLATLAIGLLPVLAAGPVGAQRPLRWEGRAAALAWQGDRESGQPDGEFRLDELRLSLESRLLPSAYARADVDAARREYDDPTLRLGELALVLHPEGDEAGSGLRLGRLAIPFGEESRSRGALDNPLVSHSLADLHGYDQGGGLLLRRGPFDVEAAVQGGGSGRGAALAGRAGWTPLWWLRLSLSGYRSGRIEDGAFSPLRFAGNRLRVAGEDYRADLAQGDARIEWENGHVHAALGRLRLRAEDGGREAPYGSVEAVQELFWGLFAAARYSRVEPGAAAGPPGEEGPRERLSLGVGFRRHADLVFKTEYTREEGVVDSDLASLQVALRY